ncbi:MAG TPA: FtsX-like permease family protein [Steroidobacteraceae bacterium]
MDLLPILRSLARRKTGALLIALQVALTVAILSNSIAVVQQRLLHMRRATGLNEADIFTLGNQFAGATTDLSARIQADLVQLRAIRGVVDAVAGQSFPLRGYGGSTGVRRTSDPQAASLNAAEYAAPERVLDTWGLRLVAGRNFTHTEIRERRLGTDWTAPAVAIVSQALARALFPKGDALGGEIYIAGTTPSRIVGIVARAQTPWAAHESAGFPAEYSVLEPLQWVSTNVAYVVRTRPGLSASLLPVAQRQLYALSHARVISEAQTFADTRAEQYRDDRSLGLILAVVCALLLTVTAFGIIALTTYWVAQRQRQIGMRRALGARRINIIQYLHTENLLIAGGGAAIGVALAMAGNVWLATSLEMGRTGVGYICLGATIVVALSQVAVTWPALRAACLPPAAAIRGR